MNEDIKKGNLKKDQTNLTETNHQINSTLIILFQVITPLKAVWMLRVLALWQLCKARWFCFGFCCKGERIRWCEFSFRRKLKRTLIINNINRSIIQWWRYKLYFNITCPNRRCYEKNWRRCSLLKNLLIVKHHAP